MTRSPFVIGFERFGKHGELPELQAGSLLIGELSCVNCHHSKDDWLQPKRGPRLNGVGNRLQQEWLRRYLSDPQVVKPGTTMPDVLSSLTVDQRAEAIDALVAFLSTQQQPFAVLKADGIAPVIHEFWKRGNRERGAEWYHSIGCVACHEPDADYETDEAKPSAIDELLEELDEEQIAELGLSAAARRVESIPHGDLPSKYTLRSLTMMLLDPSIVRPNSRMPSLRLTPQEAADIAAYLLGENVSNETGYENDQPLQQLIDRGRSLFVELRCANCHESTGVKDERQAKPLAQLDADARSSCFESPTADMARYHLDDAQRKAMLSILKGGVTPKRTASDAVSFRMLQLNCYGCHERGERGGVGRYRKAYFETVGHVDLGDEGRLPPSLTGVGRKLLPQALAAVFHPKTTPHRPYMTIRMPTYSADAVKPLLTQMAKADEVDRSKDDEVFSEPQSASIGREMVNTGCVQCHPFRGESLPGVVGIDLNDVTARVDPQWFHEFLFNPNELKNRTRMPTFFPNGKSNRPDLLEGNVDHQISAIWAYLKNLEKEPLPEKIEAARIANYELVPEERPIVLRTFMDAAGTHAIAVGFPAGVHYAFDAEHVRLAIAWKGRFLDARGTWFERFAPPAQPLGEQLVNFPLGPPFRADDPREYQFRGYRLDSKGVPTLLYKYGDLLIEDRIEPNGDTGLKRTLTIAADSSDAGVLLRAHAGKKLVATGSRAYKNDGGLMVTVSESLARAGTLQQSDDQQEWLVPLLIKDHMTIELEYQWRIAR
ncbi:MAG: c-type cytochrome [Planctomycetaceae bacterium]|nr:c-type cytochrome [Planctomycetaceae bacterium]